MDSSKVFYALAVITFVIVVWLEYNAPTRVERETKLWNNGFCTCGSSWEYERSAPDRSVDVFYFRCKNCNNIIGLREKVFVKSR